MSYAYVVIDGLIQSVPSGDVLQLRGPLDVDTYLIGFTEDAILQPADGFALQADDMGNDRGAYAVDLQQDRSNVIQVASGDYSIVGGGTRNQATVDNSIVYGGNTNQCHGTSSVVIGGRTNQIASGDFNYIGGGRGNRLDGTYNAIGGGAACRCYAEANYSVIFGGIGGLLLLSLP